MIGFSRSLGFSFENNAADHFLSARFQRIPILSTVGVDELWRSLRQIVQDVFRILWNEANSWYAESLFYGYDHFEWHDMVSGLCDGASTLRTRKTKSQKKNQRSEGRTQVATTPDTRLRLVHEWTRVHRGHSSSGREVGGDREVHFTTGRHVNSPDGSPRLLGFKQRRRM